MQPIKWFMRLEFVVRALVSFGVMTLLFQALLVFTLPEPVLMKNWQNAAPLIAQLSLSLGGLIVAIWAIVFTTNARDSDDLAFLLVLAISTFVIVMVMTTLEVVGVGVGFGGARAAISVWLVGVATTLFVIGRALGLVASKKSRVERDRAKRKGWTLKRFPARHRR